MRLELKVPNGPFVWLAFLAFMGVYVAGFDAWLPRNGSINVRDAIALRLALAGTTFAILTYIMVLLEPKDRVLYRWMGAELAQGHLGRIAWAMQGWMMSGKAAFIVGLCAESRRLRARETPHSGCGPRRIGARFPPARRRHLRPAADLARHAPRRFRCRHHALIALRAGARAIANGLGLTSGARRSSIPQPSIPAWLSPADRPGRKRSSSSCWSSAIWQAVRLARGDAGGVKAAAFPRHCQVFR